MTETPPRFDVQPGVSNHFAWLRTEMALQRTLMAAIRTSVSLIGFGFTVATFFQRMRSNVPVEDLHLGVDVPRNLGLVLIGAGILSLSVFTWQYRAADNYLHEGEFAAITTQHRMHTSIYLIAFTVLLIGVAAFGCVFIRL